MPERNGLEVVLSPYWGMMILDSKMVSSVLSVKIESSTSNDLSNRRPIYTLTFHETSWSYRYVKDMEDLTFMVVVILVSVKISPQGVNIDIYGYGCLFQCLCQCSTSIFTHHHFELRPPSSLPRYSLLESRTYCD